MLVPRVHIQNYSEASAVEPHWGYADRLVPCTSDPGSCEYLDVVYRSHDIGMYYTGIIWATIGAILLVWGVGRHFARSQPSGSPLSVATCPRPDEIETATLTPALYAYSRMCSSKPYTSTPAERTASSTEGLCAGPHQDTSEPRARAWDSAASRLMVRVVVGAPTARVSL